jgi:hypothetical protein
LFESLNASRDTADQVNNREQPDSQATAMGGRKQTGDKRSSKGNKSGGGNGGGSKRGGGRGGSRGGRGGGRGGSASASSATKTQAAAAAMAASYGFSNESGASREPVQRASRTLVVSGINIKSESRKLILNTLHKLDVVKSAVAAVGGAKASASTVDGAGAAADADENNQRSVDSTKPRGKSARKILMQQMMAAEAGGAVSASTSTTSDGRKAGGPLLKVVTSPFLVPENRQEFGKKVRCSICLPHNLLEKKSVVVTGGADLVPLLNLVKNKFKVLKKPLRAFLVAEANVKDPAKSAVIEIFSSAAFTNDALIALTNGSSFESAVETKSKGRPPAPSASKRKPAAAKPPKPPSAGELLLLLIMLLMLFLLLLLLLMMLLLLMLMLLMLLMLLFVLLMLLFLLLLLLCFVVVCVVVLVDVVVSCCCRCCCR